jgi:hypothetical protein
MVITKSCNASSDEYIEKNCILSWREKKPRLLDLSAAIKGHVPHWKTLERISGLVKHRITAALQVLLRMLL